MYLLYEKQRKWKNKILNILLSLILFSSFLRYVNSFQISQVKIQYNLQKTSICHLVHALINKKKTAAEIYVNNKTEICAKEFIGRQEKKPFYLLIRG